MTDQAGHIADSLRSVFVIAGFPAAPLDVFLNALLNGPEGALNFEDRGTLNTGAGDMRHYANTEHHEVHLLAGASDASCLICVLPGAANALDHACRDVVYGCDAYETALFYGLTGVHGILLSTVDIAEPGLVLPGVKTGFEGRSVCAGIGFAAAGAELDEDVYTQLDFGFTETLCAGSDVFAVIPLDQGRDRLWAADRRPLFMRLDWPALVPVVPEKLFAAAKVTPASITLTIPLEHDPASGAELILGGDISLRDRDGFHGELAFDLMDGKVIARMSELPDFRQLLEYVGADSVTENLPSVIDGLLGLHVDDMWIALDTGADSLADAVIATGLRVSTSDPMQIIDGMMYFTPVLEMTVIRPADSEMRAFEGMVSGEFILGNSSSDTKLTATITVPDYDMSASLKALHIADVVRVFGQDPDFLPGDLGSATCSVSVSGNVSQKTFHFELGLDNTRSATGDGAKGSWSLSNVNIGVGHEPGHTEFHLDAELLFGDPESGIVFDVAGAWDSDAGWMLEGTAEGEINLSQAAAHLVDPDCLPEKSDGDLIFSAVALSADWSTGTYAFSAHCPGAWKIIDGLSVQLDQLAVEKTGDGFSVDVVAFLTLADVALLMEAQRRTDGSWLLRGRTQHPVTLEDVARDLNAKMPDLPDFLKDFEINHLLVSYDSAKTELVFEFGVSVMLAADPIAAKLHLIACKNSGDAWELDLKVDLDVGGHPVGGRVSVKDGSSAFLGAYTAAPGEVFHTRSALALLDAGLADSLPDVAIELKSLVIAYLSVDGNGRFVAGVSLNADTMVDLSALPIGDVVGGAKLGVSDLRLCAASGDVPAKHAALLNALSQEMKISLLPDASAHADDDIALHAGLSVSANLSMGRAGETPLLLGGGGADDTGALRRTPQANAQQQKTQDQSAGAPLEKWFEIQKSIGPLFVSQVGLQYQDAHVGLLIDSGFDLGGVHVGLKGFGLSFPLKTPVSMPEVSLRGLELGYSGGPVTISGSFLATRTETGQRYDGSAVLKASGFSVAGFGSYQRVVRPDGTSDPSIFIFATLQADLGGPPEFHVKGLAGGFGYNRDLLLPDVAHVNEFPLIRALQDPDYISGATPGQSALDAIDKLADYIHAVPGENWIAAGIKAETYKVLKSDILVSVSFGTDVEIGVLGLATLSLPEKAKPGEEVAFIELGLKASLRPQEGTFFVEGRLTDKSFILSRECHLRGGFAFYVWAAGDHAGDFVITLGGYHPDFKRPGHYPVVPRLSVDWMVTRELHVMAQMYFALTPACVMAGGLLQAVYSSGRIHAAFLARADFVMYWEPLHYSGDVEISIHISVDLDLFVLTADLGVHLEFHGPEFSGKLSVRVAAVSFSIAFGKTPEAPRALSLEDFKTRFLPPAGTGAVSIAISGGLAGVQSKPALKKMHFVTPDELEFTVSSAVPFTDIAGASRRDNTFKPDTLGIAPAAIADIAPKLSVGLVRTDKSGGDPISLTSVLKTSNVPAALWDSGVSEPAVDAPKTPSAKTRRALVGARVLPDLSEAAPAKQPLDVGYQVLEDKTFDMPDRDVTVPAGHQSGSLTDLGAPPAIRGALVNHMLGTDDPEEFGFVPTEAFMRRLRAAPVFSALGATDEAQSG